VHGVLLLDKPPGLSSNDALQKVRRLLRAEKAGHTGTLDPLATGVLPLCFGAATKFSQIHLDADKTYEATLQLGVTTTTGDAEGELLESRPVPPLDAERLQAVARQFTGAITQVPPMHSALKKDGRALYEYARAGQSVERTPRVITIHSLELAPDLSDAAQTTLKMRASVSKGTYIRTLAEDIGEALGCGAHLSALRRTATGAFDVAGCITLDALAALDEPLRLARLLPPRALLAGLPTVTLDVDNAARFLGGLRRRGRWSDVPLAAVVGPDGTLLGSARVCAGELIAVRLLSPIEIRQIEESTE